MRVRQYDVRLYVLLVTDVMNKFLFLTLLIYISNAKQTTKHFYITQNSKFNFCSYMGDVLLRRRRHRIIIVTIFCEALVLRADDASLGSYVTFNDDDNNVMMKIKKKPRQ